MSFSKDSKMCEKCKYHDICKNKREECLLISLMPTANIASVDANQPMLKTATLSLEHTIEHISYEQRKKEFEEELNCNFNFNSMFGA
jgi:hypothetical protein